MLTSGRVYTRWWFAVERVPFKDGWMLGLFVTDTAVLLGLAFWCVGLHRRQVV